MLAGVFAQSDRQISNAPCHPAIGTEHVLTGHLTQQKHCRSMPEEPGVAVDVRAFAGILGTIGPIGLQQSWPILTVINR